MERYIVHVDMDAFYAAIEQRDNPSIRGKSVIVGAPPKGGRGRGVVSTASYEARALGIHSAMPISRAYRLCPDAVFLPVNMGKYAVASDEIYTIFEEFTPVIEPVSIDEAFLDITGSYHLFGSARKSALAIKSRIKEKTGLIASVGLAPTKMVAKIASDLGKPDGFIEVSKENVRAFLNPLTVDNIWGLGEKTKETLNRMGITTIGDLAQRSSKELCTALGKNGYYFFKLARGSDEREVETEQDVKSVSNEFTFENDTRDQEEIHRTLMVLCEKVSHSLRQQNIRTKTITLKIRLASFKTYTRARTIPRPTNFVDVIYHEIVKLFGQFNTHGEKVRLLGVKASNLTHGTSSESLFRDERDEKRERMHRAIEKIRRKFGAKAISRGQV